MGDAQGMSAKALSKDAAASSQLKTVIICQDLESGKHAKELADHLLCALNSRIQFVPDAWTFGALQHPHLQEQAAREINQADIILFSIRGDAAVPRGIKQWLERRLAQADQPRALVVLFGQSANADETDSTRVYLENIAASRSLDFFAEPPQSEDTGEEPVLSTKT